MADLYDGIDLKQGTTHNEQVQALQRDLRELGFSIVGEADGTFGLLSYWAVREFQAYASMIQVAQESAPAAAIYADRLTPVETGPHRYQGPVSGVVNAATRTSLAHWLENRWRCPVVVEAWRMKNRKRHQIQAENLWLHDDLASTTPRMYARDLSGYFDGIRHSDGDDRIVIGDYANYLSWGGPRSVPPSHTRPEGEILPENLVGAPLDEFEDDARSTYKVVRAVSEVECIGYFDSVNSYDNAFVSVGPCHWTLGIASRGGNVSEGELCGYLAYLRHADPGAYAKAFGFFGLAIDEDWVDGGAPNGAALYNRSQRKYAGWVALQKDDGGFARVHEREEEGDYFKTWHWFYRFVMAGRAVSGYQRGMWDMARIRLRDLLDAPWPTDAATRIGDVFTSEKAMAMILRWHIRFPANIVSGGSAGRNLVAAFERARGDGSAVDWDSAPETWGDAHEKALLSGLRTQSQRAGGGLPDTIKRVDRWPQWATGNNRRAFRLSPDIGGLSEVRGSLKFDASGLPPAP